MHNWQKSYSTISDLSLQGNTYYDKSKGISTELPGYITIGTFKQIKHPVTAVYSRIQAEQNLRQFEHLNMQISNLGDFEHGLTIGTPCPSIF